MLKTKGGIAVPESYLPFKVPERKGWRIIARDYKEDGSGNRGTIGVKEITVKGAWASFKEEIINLTDEDVEQIVDLLIQCAKIEPIIDGVTPAPVPVVKESGKWRMDDAN